MIYTGASTSSHELLLQGFSPGAEAGWALWITGPSRTAPAPDKSLRYVGATQFLSNLVFENPSWDPNTFKVDRDSKITDDKVAATLNSTDPNLARFRSRGGKLILYQGWSDSASPPRNSINYYQAVEKTMGRKKTDTFLRLFMVAGMGHCGGGLGPSSFGQEGGGDGDPHDDITRALEQWVEQGVAPHQLIAAKYNKDSDPASGVARTRPICAYPLFARYKGSGSGDDAANFVCAKK
jgi:feruloyl esterase